VYEYACTTCGPHRTDQRADNIQCPSCGGRARRVWGFTYRPGFQAGYNPSVGRYVSSGADLRSAFSAASDKASAPTTLYDVEGNRYDIDRPPVNFQPVDLRDKERLGVTEEGLPATYDALKRQGNDPAADRLRSYL